ncbi:hypothetical protein KCP77_16695 [Salmonella enterica subsp. enterica]|nr:hypothetical protein KCP77_16695 [Salmonella enterica subsp. enterica]
MEKTTRRAGFMISTTTGPLMPVILLIFAPQNKRDKAGQYLARLPVINYEAGLKSDSMNSRPHHHVARAPYLL